MLDSDPNFVHFLFLQLCTLMKYIKYLKFSEIMTKIKAMNISRDRNLKYTN